MIDTSAILGTFEISEVPSARRQAAINFSTEFLAPGTMTRPERSPARRTVMIGSPSTLDSDPGLADTGNSMLPPRRDVSAPSCDDIRSTATAVPKGSPMQLH